MCSVVGTIPSVFIATPSRSPSPSKREPARPVATSELLTMMRSPSPKKHAPTAGLGLPSELVTFRSYCEDLINFEDYPDLSLQNRSIINGFLNGDLLKNDKWREKFPSGKFECVLQASNGSQAGDFGCKEKIVFKIDFQRVACAKSITRRAWSSKTRTIDTGSDFGSESPVKTPSARSSHSRKRTPKQRRASYPQETESPHRETPKRSSSFPSETATSRRQTPRRGSGSEADSAIIELQSPIKAKRKTPSRRVSTRKDTPHRRVSSRTTPKASPPAKRAKTSVKKTKPKVQNDQIWSVSEILDHKTSSGKDLFLVRWEGLDAKGKPWDDTWEPEANISRDLIAQFWKEHKKGKKSTGPKSKK